MQLLVITLVLILGTIFVILVTSFYWLIKLGLIIYACCLCHLHLRKQILLTHPMSILGLCQSNALYWTMLLANQEVIYGRLRANSVITNFLLVLNFSYENNRKLTAIIVPASVGPAAFRQLLAYLRHTKHR